MCTSLCTRLVDIVYVRDYTLRSEHSAHTIATKFCLLAYIFQQHIIASTTPSPKSSLSRASQWKQPKNYSIKNKHRWALVSLRFRTDLLFILFIAFRMAFFLASMAALRCW